MSSVTVGEFTLTLTPAQQAEVESLTAHLPNVSKINKTKHLHRLFAMVQLCRENTMTTQDFMRAFNINSSSIHADLRNLYTAHTPILSREIIGHSSFAYRTILVGDLSIAMLKSHRANGQELAEKFTIERSPIADKLFGFTDLVPPSIGLVMTAKDTLPTPEEGRRKAAKVSVGSSLCGSYFSVGI